MSNSTQFKPPVQSPASDPSNFSMDELEKRLKLIQLQRLEREEALVAEAEKSAIIARKAGIDSIRMKMASDAARQNACNHVKENGRTHLAGQKDHSGVINLICQQCQKHWRGDYPQGLFPTGDGAVGGPG